MQTYREIPDGYLTMTMILEDVSLNVFGLDRNCLKSRFDKAGIKHDKLNRCGVEGFRHSVANLYKIDDIKPHLYAKICSGKKSDAIVSKPEQPTLDLKMAKAFITRKLYD